MIRGYIRTGFGTQKGVFGGGFVQPDLVARGAVQPNCAPNQFILIAAPGVVKRRCIGDGIRIFSAISIGEIVERDGIIQQQSTVSGVALRKNHTRRCHGCRRFARQIGTGIGGIYEVGGTRHLHHFGGSPPGVVCAAVAHLPVKFFGRAVRISDVAFQEIIIDKFQAVQQSIPLLNRIVSRLVFHTAPRQHGGRIRHGEAEFDVVTGIEPTARQVETVRAVAHGGVAAPVYAVVLRQGSALLCFVKEKGFLQDFAVVVIAVGGRWWRRRFVRNVNHSRGGHIERIAVGRGDDYGIHARSRRCPGAFVNVAGGVGERNSVSVRRHFDLRNRAVAVGCRSGHGHVAADLKHLVVVRAVNRHRRRFGQHGRFAGTGIFRAKVFPREIEAVAVADKSIGKITQHGAAQLTNRRARVRRMRVLVIRRLVNTARHRYAFAVENIVVIDLKTGNHHIQINAPDEVVFELIGAKFKMRAIQIGKLHTRQRQTLPRKRAEKAGARRGLFRHKIHPFIAAHAEVKEADFVGRGVKGNLLDKTGLMRANIDRVRARQARAVLVSERGTKVLLQMRIRNRVEIEPLEVFQKNAL